MQVLGLFAAIVLFVGQTLAMKTVKAERLDQKMLIFGVFCALAVVFAGIAWIFAPGLRAVDGTTLLLGAAFGVLFAATIFVYNRALETGPMSFTAFCFTASMVVPAISGIAFFGEKLTLSVFASIALFLVAFWLINITPGTEKRAASRQWIFFSAATFLFNGALSVIQKTQGVISGGGKEIAFMLMTFVCAFVCYAGIWLITRKRESAAPLIRANAASIVVLAASSMFGNFILTILVAYISASYLYPIVCGSVLLTATICSVYVFKEKLSAQGWIGAAVALVAIFVMNIG